MSIYQRTRQNEKFSPAPITLSAARKTPLAALATTLPVNIFPNKLAPNVPNDITRNPWSMTSTKKIHLIVLIEKVELLIILL